MKCDCVLLYTVYFTVMVWQILTVKSADIFYSVQNAVLQVEYVMLQER